MNSIQELKERIARGENIHTEFKTWPIHADDLAAALVAFANSDSGQLFLGVDDHGQVVGTADPDRAMQQVDNVACQNCEPPLLVVQETIKDEHEQTIVIVNVPKGDQRPYRTNRGVYYIRATSGRRQASRQELLRLFQSTASLYYDETLIYRATLADLRLEIFDHFLQQAYGRRLEEWDLPPERLLQNLRLVRDNHPTMAGLLFLGKRPQEFIPQAHVVAARIPGADLAAAPRDVKTIDGALLTVLEDTTRFLQLHLPVAHIIKEFEPENKPELPPEALREIVLNALAHRDYTVAAPIRIFIYDDRVEVRSPGGLPNTVTIEAIKLGAAHILRNPTIYTLFSRLGLVTGIGSGVYRAIQLVRRAVGREPNLYYEGTEFVVALPRKSKRERESFSPSHSSFSL